MILLVISYVETSLSMLNDLEYELFWVGDMQ